MLVYRLPVLIDLATFKLRGPAANPTVGSRSKKRCHTVSWASLSVAQETEVRRGTAGDVYFDQPEPRLLRATLQAPATYFISLRRGSHYFGHVLLSSYLASTASQGSVSCQKQRAICIELTRRPFGSLFRLLVRPIARRISIFLRLHRLGLRARTSHTV